MRRMKLKANNSSRKDEEQADFSTKEILEKTQQLIKENRIRRQDLRRTLAQISVE